MTPSINSLSRDERLPASKGACWGWGNISTGRIIGRSWESGCCTRASLAVLVLGGLDGGRRLMIVWAAARSRLPSRRIPADPRAGDATATEKRPVRLPRWDEPRPARDARSRRRSPVVRRPGDGAACRTADNCWLIAASARRSTLPLTRHGAGRMGHATIADWLVFRFAGVRDAGGLDRRSPRRPEDYFLAGRSIPVGVAGSISINVAPTTWSA